jgi:hypothetical protein
MSHLTHSVVFCDTQFEFGTWISDKSFWSESRVATSMAIMTGNSRTQLPIDESNARALIVALEQHINNISQVRNEFIAIQQIQKKEATA